MDKKLNIRYHCGVTNDSKKFLLDCQKNKILEFFDDVNVRIIGISQEVNFGNQPHTRAIELLRIYILRGLLDAFIVIDKTRLFFSYNHYQEFRLFCDMYKTQIIDLQTLEVMF